MGIRRLVRPSAHAVSNGMRWLARITRSRNPFPQDAINVPERRAFSNTRDSIGENLQELVEQTVVFPGKPPWTNICREIVPIAAGADPDPHQRRPIPDPRPMAGGVNIRNALPIPAHL